uniref:Uncharacterized protein n=2 Tax=Prymnesium polylepis TaxID=72548 RepID=A0A7S4JG04_9EUKA
MARDAFAACLQLEPAQLAALGETLVRQLEHKSKQAAQHAAALLLMLEEPGVDLERLARGHLPADWFICCCQAAIDNPMLAVAASSFFQHHEAADNDEDVRNAIAAVNEVLFAPGSTAYEDIHSHFEAASKGSLDVPASIGAGNCSSTRVQLLRRGSSMYLKWLKSAEAEQMLLSSHVSIALKQPRGLSAKQVAAWRSCEVELEAAVETARLVNYRVRASMAPVSNMAMQAFEQAQARGAEAQAQRRVNALADQLCSLATIVDDTAVAEPATLPEPATPPLPAWSLPPPDRPTKPRGKICMQSFADAHVGGGDAILSANEGRQVQMAIAATGSMTASTTHESCFHLLPLECVLKPHASCKNKRAGAKKAELTHSEKARDVNPRSVEQARKDLMVRLEQAVLPCNKRAAAMNKAELTRSEKAPDVFPRSIDQARKNTIVWREHWSKSVPEKAPVLGPMSWWAQYDSDDESISYGTDCEGEGVPDSDGSYDSE